MMDNDSKEIQVKLELLELLKEDLADHEIGRMHGSDEGEPIAIVEEKQVMPSDQAVDEIQERLAETPERMKEIKEARPELEDEESMMPAMREFFRRSKES